MANRPSRRTRPKTERSPPYSDTLLADLANRLKWAQARLARELRGRMAETMPQDPERSWHAPREQAADEYAQSINVELLHNDADALGLIEDALERLDGRGEQPYGRCQPCADAPQHLCRTCPWIPEERLIAIPWAQHCAPVQERLDQHELTSVAESEEETAPPHSRRVPMAQVRALERAQQHAHAFLTKVMHALACDNREHAYAAVRSTLPALRDRLPVAEAAHLAAQLPLVLRGVFYAGWRGGDASRPDRSSAQFLAEIACGPSAPAHPPEAMARAVMHALAQTVSAGEITEVKQALPRHVRELWPG
jgi:uncharacterized protein (DUF2267 family)/RNA polymerase-binding transcription factor DksA